MFSANRLTIFYACVWCVCVCVFVCVCVCGNNVINTFAVWGRQVHYELWESAHMDTRRKLATHPDVNSVGASTGLLSIVLRFALNAGWTRPN